MEDRALSSDILCRNSEEPECGGGCYLAQHPGTPSTRGWYFSQKAVMVQGGYGACFCNPGTSLIEYYECRGTRLVSGQEFLPVQDV